MAFALGLPVAGSAQLGGGNLPDLSGVAGAISNTVAPKAAGTFSSGLSVPSVDPGAAAKGIGHGLRVGIESKTGQKNAALQRLEDEMPADLAKLETGLQGLGLAKRDFGVAVGYFFVTMYETATGRTVPPAASLTAGRTMAKATAARWGSRFNALPAAKKESLYESLMTTPMLMEALTKQFVQAGKTAEAQTMRQGAASAFKSLFGTDASAVGVDANGRITGFSGGKAAPPTASVGGAKTSLPAGGLTPSSLSGARVFVMYVVPINGSSPIDELVLFPDGTAIDDLPSGPVAGFDVATVRAASRKPNVGHWTQSGDRLTVQIGRGKPDVYVKDPSGGWADPERKSGEFGVYFPVLAATPAALAGAWHSETIASVGVPGGAGPMTFGGSTGDLVFSPDGTYAKGGRGFASTTGGTGDVTAIGKGRRSQGRWRLDGLLLTTVENGQRGVQLAYALPHWSHAGKASDIMIQGRRWSRPEK